MPILAVATRLLDEVAGRAETLSPWPSRRREPAVAVDLREDRSLGLGDLTAPNGPGAQPWDDREHHDPLCSQPPFSGPDVGILLLWARTVTS